MPFHSGKELEQTLLQYAKVYNHQIPQKALGHISPIQALKNWQKKHPELFKKRVYNLTGLDSYLYRPKTEPIYVYGEITRSGLIRAFDRTGILYRLLIEPAS